MAGIQKVLTWGFEKLSLRSDLARAVRTSVAVMVPLVVWQWLGRPVDGIFIAMAAQGIALHDLRGAYVMRLAIIATITLVVACSALLGVLAGASLVSAVLAMGVIALLSGCWRHFSADYGPPLGVASALLFLLGLSQPGTWDRGLHLVGLVFLGGVWATLLHISFWPFRPQHPLRNAVAESWVAAADLVAVLRPNFSTTDCAQNESIHDAQRVLRATLDRTFVILGSAVSGRHALLLSHLEEMRRQVVHFSMRVIAFHTALEKLSGRPDFVRILPAIDCVLIALSDAARSVAITLIAHRPENFAASEVRLQRCGHLLEVLDSQIAQAPVDLDTAQIRASLSPLAEGLLEVRQTLVQTIDYGLTRQSFPGKLPELDARSIQSLAAWINPAPQIDPVLVRHSLRMALLTMAAVALYLGFHIPRGYWIAFTIVVVLQPDFGATLQRAGERTGGTLAGSIIGSFLLWVKMPLSLLHACAALMAFGFAYFLKRQYGVAVFFVTLMIVLITEITMPLHLDFTFGRLLCNLFGALVALVAALVFWPIWERGKFNLVLADAVNANRDFLDALATYFGDPKPDSGFLLMAKRRAENANRLADASLKRLLSEPGELNEEAERAVALVTYNQRITRAFIAMAVHLETGAALECESGGLAFNEVCRTLKSLTTAILEQGTDGTLSAQVANMERAFAQVPIPLPHPQTGTYSHADLIWTHLAKSLVEIRAMICALNGRSRRALSRIHANPSADFTD